MFLHVKMGVVFIFNVLIFCKFTTAYGESFVNLPEINRTKIDYEVDAGGNISFYCQGDVPLNWTIPDVPKNNAYRTNVTITDEIPKNKQFKNASRISIRNASFPFTGFYYCHQKEVAPTKINATNEKELQEKLKNYVYLYVKDLEHLSVLDKVDDVNNIDILENETGIVPCRSTFPDSVKIELTDMNLKTVDFQHFKHFGFIINPSTEPRSVKCIYYLNDILDSTETYSIWVENKISKLNIPNIVDEEPYYHVVGKPMTLTCNIETNVKVLIKWTVPSASTQHFVEQNSYNDTHLYQILTIKNVNLKDTGSYRCEVFSVNQKYNSSSQIYVHINDIGYSFLNLTAVDTNITVVDGASSAEWKIKLEGYPKPDLELYKWTSRNFTKEIDFKSKIDATHKWTSIIIFNINKYNHHGEYTLVAYNTKDVKTITLMLNVTFPPILRFEYDEPVLTADEDKKLWVVYCIVGANPTPKISWQYKPCFDNTCDFGKITPVINPSSTKENNYLAKIPIKTKKSGIVRCLAENSFNITRYREEKYYIQDIPKPICIFNMNTNNVHDKRKNADRIVETESITLTCATSVRNFSKNITWLFNGNTITKNNRISFANTSTEFSNRIAMTINNVTKNDEGQYFCEGMKKANGEINIISLNLTVKKPKPPVLRNTYLKPTIKMNYPDPLILSCLFDNFIKYELLWYKDNQLLLSEKDKFEFKNNNQILVIPTTDLNDEGIYICNATNKYGSSFSKFDVSFKNKPSKEFLYIGSGISSLSVLVTISFIILYKIKQRKLKKLIASASEKFKKGALDKMNPHLGIEDQADLLPYLEKFEFSVDNLHLGKQLGAGAFGVVLKGEANNITKGEEKTNVAVKKPKNNADDIAIKALASELKIMCHIGKHLNVVNLLGACTKNIAKRELFVIVEYCKFGNLHDYISHNRDHFVNQIDPKTQEIDFNIGKAVYEKSFSISSSSPSGMQLFSNDNQNMCNQSFSKNESSLKREQSDSAIQPDWRSNYQGDYLGIVKPIFTKDLLIWAYQVASGMEYLASRKVMHGDLAARNILLADDNIVKICDFGLAKSVYNSEIYKKNSGGPLPFKWMAIESIEDRVFSTQSDVWSFGIVLWEFFSLAKTPYPGMYANELLLNKLVNGYRMDAPQFATKNIYKLMRHCWDHKPQNRPSFSTLFTEIGKMLDDTSRANYINLNTPYMIMNAMESEDDYLPMVCSPKFENFSSHHHYTNDLPKPQNNPSGYLPMNQANVFSPKQIEHMVFTFDQESNYETEKETTYTASDFENNCCSNLTYQLALAEKTQEEEL